MIMVSFDMASDVPHARLIDPTTSIRQQDPRVTVDADGGSMPMAVDADGCRDTLAPGRKVGRP
jgi:hypothetical protein